VSPDAAGGQQPGAGTQAAVPALHFCKDCTQYRERGRSELFSPDELHSAGALKARTEWEQQNKQHAERELQLLSSNQQFTYEPHTVPWCASYTKLDDVEKANAGDQEAVARLMQQGGAVVDAVSGKFSPIYAVCIRMNPRGTCERYEHR
jgi:hypothetical protein